MLRVGTGVNGVVTVRLRLMQPCWLHGPFVDSFVEEVLVDCEEEWYGNVNILFREIRVENGRIRAISAVGFSVRAKSTVDVMDATIQCVTALNERR